MIVWAVLLLAVSAAVAGSDLVVIRVVLLLLPSVAIDATILQVAPVRVSPRLLLSAPKAALFLGRVLVYVGLAPVVLPIMRIFTLVTHVTAHLVIEWTPDSFEVEHVEVRVLLHPVQQVN